MNTIYYCYDNKTNKFCGSGITEVNDESYSSTTIPCPKHDPKIEYLVFKNNTWQIIKK
jgi:hypothetical protein